MGKKSTELQLSVDNLLANGWVKTDDPISPFKKVLPNRNPINDTPEDSDICLIIHRYYNSQMFAVLLPDGGMLNFIANDMNELAAFENALNFYDPSF